MKELNSIQDALALLGLSKNAIQFYLESFTSGKNTVGRIAVRCGMDRSSAYLVLVQLKKLGLLEEERKGKQSVVWAKSPQGILTKLRAEIRKIRSVYDEIETKLPELSALYGEAGTKPVLQYYSGLDGLKQITEDVFEHARGEILLLTNQQEEQKVFSESDHRYFIKQRIAKQIRIRVLAVDSPEARTLKKHDGRSLRQTRIIPKTEHVPFTTETYIYGDKVANLGFTNDIIGFIVHSKDFAQTQRWVFEGLWERYQ